MKLFPSVIALFLVVLPASAYAADGVLFMAPERATYSIRDTFEVQVRANTDGALANAAEAELSFNPEGLNVEHISIDTSVLSMWVTPPTFNNDKGTIKFSGVADADFSGDDELLLTITFRALRPIGNDLRFVSGTMLAADGRGSNIITAMRSGLYTIEPRNVIPSAPGETFVEGENVDPAVKGATISVPSFTHYDHIIQVGDRIIAEGQGPPDTLVTVLTQRGDETPVMREVRTTLEGGFTYVAPERAKKGVYRMWSELRESEIAYAVSDRVSIQVQPMGLMAAAAGIASVVGAATPLLALLLVAGLCIGFVLHRRRLE